MAPNNTKNRLHIYVDILGMKKNGLYHSRIIIYNDGN